MAVPLCTVASVCNGCTPVYSCILNARSCPPLWSSTLLFHLNPHLVLRLMPPHLVGFLAAHVTSSPLTCVCFNIQFFCIVSCFYVFCSFCSLHTLRVVAHQHSPTLKAKQGAYRAIDMYSNCSGGGITWWCHVMVKSV